MMVFIWGVILSSTSHLGLHHESLTASNTALLVLLIGVLCHLMRVSRMNQCHYKSTNHLTWLWWLQVALLFLAPGAMPHEEVWTAWIGALAEKTRSEIFCNPEAFACYDAQRKTGDEIHSVYDQQDFFTIYLHTSPGLCTSSA